MEPYRCRDRDTRIKSNSRRPRHPRMPREAFILGRIHDDRHALRLNRMREKSVFEREISFINPNR